MLATLGSLLFGFINIFNGAPWKTDIRGLWISILVGIMAVLPILYNLIIPIGKLVVYMVLLPKKLIFSCKEKPR